MDAWLEYDRFPFGFRPIFRCELLVLERVYPYWQFYIKYDSTMTLLYDSLTVFQMFGFCTIIGVPGNAIDPIDLGPRCPVYPGRASR